MFVCCTVAIALGTTFEAWRCGFNSVLSSLELLLSKDN